MQPELWTRAVRFRYGVVARRYPRSSRTRFLEFLDRPDGTPVDVWERIRDDFIALAKEYSQAEGIPAAAFRALGVPDQLLVAAGIVEQQWIDGRRVISVPGF